MGICLYTAERNGYMKKVFFAALIITLLSTILLSGCKKQLVIYGKEPYYVYEDVVVTEDDASEDASSGSSSSGNTSHNGNPGQNTASGNNGTASGNVSSGTNTSEKTDSGNSDSNSGSEYDTRYDKPTSGTNTACLINPITGQSDAQAETMRKKIVGAESSVPAVSGTVWYISQNGNNGADGKSAASAWKTLGANTAKIKSGDAVLFERGGVYRETFTALSGVYYGAYGVGDKPRIYGSSRNLANVTWQSGSRDNLWTCMGFENDVGIVVFEHGEEVGTKKDSENQCRRNGDFYYSSGQLTLYLDKGNPSTLYKSIEAGENRVIIGIGGCQDTVLDNLCLKYGGGHAIQGDRTKNIEIKNCEIGWIGGSYLSGTTRYGNAIELWAAADNVTVDNCWIYQCYDTGFTAQSTGGGAQCNIKLLNCLLEYNWYSTEMWNNGGTDNTQDNIEFSGNIMRFAGYGWGSQRSDTVNSSHLFGGGQMTNFKALNNIFDLGLQSLLDCQVKGFEGNTYIQTKGSLLGSGGGRTYTFDDNVSSVIASVLGDSKATVNFAG